jgi:hypothetical protein
MKGFNGTPCYTHRAVYRMFPGKEWEPKDQYDKSSLAFSMAALSQPDKRHLWKSFPPFDIADARNTNLKNDWLAWVEDRSTVAWTRLASLGFEEPVWKPLCFDSDTNE